MSAQFLLKFRLSYVRVVAASEREVCELVSRAEGTVFTSEAEAWIAASRLNLPAEFCSVAAANEEGRMKNAERGTR